MKIVCIGDSLTYGYGVTEAESWVSLLSLKINSKIINRGVPGNTTSDMKQRFMKDVAELNPSRVLIMGGTNDLFLGGNVKNILSNIDTMVQVSLKNNIVPTVLTPLNVNDDVRTKIFFEDMDYNLVNKKLIELRNQLIRYTDEKKVRCIDLGNTILMQNKIKDYFLDDGIHVSKEVHEYIAEIIFEFMVI